MKNIRLSCGCWVEDYTEAMMTSIKSWTREGNKSIEIGMYCIYCRDNLGDDVLETIEDEVNWMEQECD